MISVIGMELGQAEALLAANNIRSISRQLDCRKGPIGNCARVIREKELADGTVELVFALFREEVL